MSNPNCDICEGECQLQFFNGVPLQRHCPECKGERNVTDTNSRGENYTHECYECNGYGYLFTDAGVELRDFVTDHCRVRVNVSH